MFNHIKKNFFEDDLIKKNCIGLVSDEASTLRGVNNSVLTKCKEELAITKLFEGGCFDHKLDRVAKFASLAWPE